MAIITNRGLNLAIISLHLDCIAYFAPDSDYNLRKRKVYEAFWYKG